MKNKKALSLVLFLLVLVTPSIANAMHVMEGYLPKGWALFWFAMTAPFFVIGMKKLNKIMEEDTNTKLLLAVCGAFAFVLSALKIPSVVGSCSHPTGVGLGAILFGPYVMVVMGVIVLLFQALLLAHGGITTLGANAFSMAVVGPIVSFFTFKLLKKSGVKPTIAVFTAAFLGDFLTYVTTSIQLGLAFPAEVGGIMASITKFLGIFATTQLPIAIGEGIITVIVYNLIVEYKKEGGLALENLN